MLKSNRCFGVGSLKHSIQAVFYIVIAAALIVSLSLIPSAEALPSFPLKRHGGSLLPRILGGSDANKKDYPFIVYLSNSADSSYCGGSIISDQWILTAAHCIKSASAADVKVYIGQANYNPDPSKAVSVAEVHNHPQYDDSTMVNDISLLRLSSKISESNAATIDIDSSTIGDGTTVTALGWGYTSETNTTPSTSLKKVDLVTLSQAQCGSKDTKFTGNDGERICVASDNGKATCPGDSGGPLIRKVGGKNKLVGITSFGTAGPGQSVTVNCGGTGMVSLFTHASYFKTFIDTTTGGLRSIESTKNNNDSLSSETESSTTATNLNLESVSDSKTDSGATTVRGLTTSSMLLAAVSIIVASLATLF